MKLWSRGERIVATGEATGPVNALDKALRNALEKSYPGLADLELTDFKVRILEGSHGTGAVTRVLIETSDGNTSWDTDRRRREHHRRVLAGPRGRRRLRALAPGRAARRLDRRQPAVSWRRPAAR